jgi:hypothetical protein
MENHMLKLNANQQDLLAALKSAYAAAIDAQEKALATHKALDSARQLKQLVEGEALCQACMAKIDEKIASTQAVYDRQKALVTEATGTVHSAQEALEAALPDDRRQWPESITDALDQALESFQENPAYFR